MDCHHCITESAERKKGQHLRMEDRGAIKVLKKLGLGTRAIARQIGCAPSTVTNELRRGTPARKSNKNIRFQQRLCRQNSFAEILAEK